DLPEVGQGDDHVVETAGAPELAIAGMVAAGPDETEGPLQLSPGQGRHPRHHRTHRFVSGGAEAVFRHQAQDFRGVHLEDHLLGGAGGLEHPDVGLFQQGFQGLGKIPQPVADGQIALAAERWMVEDAYFLHFREVPPYQVPNLSPTCGCLAAINSGAFTFPSSLVRKRLTEMAPPATASLRPRSLTARISPAAAWGDSPKKAAL